jgi:hypothetical protein
VCADTEVRPSLMETHGICRLPHPQRCLSRHTMTGSLRIQWVVLATERDHESRAIYGGVRRNEKAHAANAAPVSAWRCPIPDYRPKLI